MKIINSYFFVPEMNCIEIKIHENLIFNYDETLEYFIDPLKLKNLTDFQHLYANMFYARKSSLFPENLGL